MLSNRSLASLAATLALAGCASAGMDTLRLPASAVAAQGETTPVGTANRDAADDPAIWRNAANPAASLIVGTDKRAGIHSYGLDGQQRGFFAAGEVNNVDLRDGVEWAGQPIILVGASDRNDLSSPRILLLALDPVSGQFTHLATLHSEASGEAYGFCFGRIAGERMPRAYVITKEGAVQEYLLAAPAGARGAALTAGREWRVGSQSEGCTVDDRTGQLYLGEEDVGIWRIDLAAASSVPVPFATVGQEDGLVADVEGLAIAPAGTQSGYLIASSQGDNAYALFDLETGVLRGRFRINGGTIGGTSETDGIEVALGDFGPAYPDGLFIAQDGDNAPAAQNFKLVSWGAIRAAVGL